jgi:hypothetical protein
MGDGARRAVGLDARWREDRHAAEGRVPAGARPVKSCRRCGPAEPFGSGSAITVRRNAGDGRGRVALRVASPARGPDAGLRPAARGAGGGDGGATMRDLVLARLRR